MKSVRLLLPATSLALAAAVSLPARAQMPHDSMKNHVSDSISRQTQHWHFDGKVSTIDPGAHQITINADSIPQQAGGQTTLPTKSRPQNHSTNTTSATWCMATWWYGT